MRALGAVLICLTVMVGTARADFFSRSGGQFPVSGGGGTALETLANSLNAGEWGELTTTNLVPTIGETYASTGNIVPWAIYLTWDPILEKIMYVGGDHNDDIRGVQYNAATGAWSIMPQESWMVWTGVAYHGGDTGDIDATRSEFYYIQFGSRKLRRYDLNAGTWTDLGDITPGTELNTWQAADTGVAWFPEMGTTGSVIAYNNGNLLKWDRSTGTWTRLWTTTPCGYHTWAQYNPVHGFVLFGGCSNDATALYKVSSAGVVTTLTDAPFALYISGSASPIVADPVTGKYLFLKCKYDGGQACQLAGDSEFWEYDAAADSWSQLPDGAGTTIRDVSALYKALATPIPEHGVVLFMFFSGNVTGSVWVYKHAE